MGKLTVLLMLATLGLAQDSSEIIPNKENESVVTVLNLSGKDITTASLHDYDFSKYPLLEDLDLSNNEIEHIPTEILSKNSALKKLNLSGNTKLQLPQYHTLLIANVEEINLSNCGIEELPLNVFDGLLHLKTIDLSNNPLLDEAIQVSTVINLVSLQKIILPHIDEVLIEDICKEAEDITIEVNHEDSIDSVQCTDVTAGSWHMERKKKPEYTASNHNDAKQKQDEEDLTINDDEYIEENGETAVAANEEIQTHLDLENESSKGELDTIGGSGESANKENKKRQASEETGGGLPSEADGNLPAEAEGNLPAEAEGNLPAEAEGNLPAEADGNLPAEADGNLPAEADGNLPAEADENLPAETDGDLPSEPNVDPPIEAGADVPSETGEEKPNDDHQEESNHNDDDVPAEPAPEDTKNENTNPEKANDEPNETQDNQGEEKVPESSNADNNNTDPHHDEPPNADNEDLVLPENPVDIPDSNDLNIPDTAATTLQPQVPDAIDGPIVQRKQDENQIASQSPTAENHEHGNEDKVPNQGVAVQRGLIINNKNDIEKSAASEKNQESKSAVSEQTKAAESTESSSSAGTSILIFLVVAVVVAGVAAFGYKFYKSRTYQATHTSEPVERELKEIVVERKANGPAKDTVALEQEPLMNARGNSVEIKELKEITEATETQMQQNENNETSKVTPNATVLNNQNNTGPYMPTTTPINPGSDIKDNETPQK